MKTQRALRLAGQVMGLFETRDPKIFKTTEVDTLRLSFEGLAGDRHGGLTRRSGGREPWYPRGTEIRNERQLSLLAPADLMEIAQRLEIEQVRPEWIGGNLLIEGIPHFTLLPPRTCLFFAGGVTIRVDGLNVPCRSSGRAIAQHYPGRERLDLAFVKAAHQRRGLVGWVEKPGRIERGEAVEARLPEHWLYPIEP